MTTARTRLTLSAEGCHDWPISVAAHGVGRTLDGGRCSRYEVVGGATESRQPGPNLVTAVALQAKDVSVIARAGVRNVIDLRVDSETPDFDEAAAVRDAGLLYHNLPIRGAEDLTRDNAARFDRLMSMARRSTARPNLRTFYVRVTRQAHARGDGAEVLFRRGSHCREKWVRRGKSSSGRATWLK